MASATLIAPAPQASPVLVPPTNLPALVATQAVLALDLGTTTGWALRNRDDHITSGTLSFKVSAAARPFFPLAPASW
jgi:hypothetical protein